MSPNTFKKKNKKNTCRHKYTHICTSSRTSSAKTITTNSDYHRYLRSPSSSTNTATISNYRHHLQSPPPSPIHIRHHLQSPITKLFDPLHHFHEFRRLLLYPSSISIYPHSLIIFKSYQI